MKGNKCGVIVGPPGLREIARVVEYFLEQPSLRRETDENGQRAVVMKYNWEKEAQKLLNLYGELFSETS